MKRANHDNHDRQHHARFMLEKRQRLPLTTSADDEDAAVSTVPVARTTVRASSTAAGRQPLTTSEVEEEDEPTSIVRGGRVPLSSSSSSSSSSSASASIGRGRPAATITTTSSTSSAAAATSTEEEVVVTVTPTPIPRTTSSTTAARTTSTTSPSSAARSVATTSSTSTSPTSATSGLVNGAASPNGQNGASSNEGGGSNAGAIAGAVIGVIAVLAIAIFFGLRWRKKKQRQAEDAAIFNNSSSSGNNPGSGGTFAAFGAKRQSAAAAGYNRHLDSFEDLHSNDKDLPHPNDNDNEKTPSSGMAGYGTLALNASTNNNNNPNRNSFAGRGNAFTSPSHTTLLGQSDYNNSTTNINNEYPPTTGMGMQTQAFRSRPPSATMMAHPVEAYNASATHLPAHQDQALSNALRNSVNLGNGSSVYAAGVPLPHSPAVSNAEYAQPAASRQSMNTAATAAAAAALGTASSSNFQQQEQEEQAGPFGDPSHEGKVYIVTRIFEPSMPDELVFFPGDRIQIVVTYDDGWCLGCNLDSPNRDGQAPARGVFPRDCVEEMTIPESGPAGPASRPVSNAQSIHEQGLSPANFDEDQPLNRGGASSLQRAPTLPPLDIGNSSRFSMGSSSAGPQSAIQQQQQQARQSQRLSKRQSKLVPESDADDEMEDAYGGVLAGGPTPTSTTFPPEIQVSQSPAVTLGPNRASHNFGSSQNIADYAAQLGETHNTTTINNNRSSKRLSTLDEENSQIIDDFPSTPRTAQAARSPNLYEGASPAGSARLSIAGIPKSSSASSIKRTSSLIASKDADLFLALGDALGKNKN